MRHWCYSSPKRTLFAFHKTKSERISLAFSRLVHFDNRHSRHNQYRLLLSYGIWPAWLQMLVSLSPHGQITTFSYCSGCIPYTETCSGKSIDDRIISDMMVDFSGTQTTSQDITFLVAGTNCCGPRVYTLSALSSILSISTVAAVSTLTLSANLMF